MIKNPIVLTLDFGTQSVRSALVDDTGNIVDIVKIEYTPTYLSPKKGYAEQDPNYYWEIAKNSLKKLTKNNAKILNNIIGASVSTFRDTSVQLDDNNNPVRPCILWLDQRLAQGKEKLPWWHWFIFKIIGMKPTIVFNRARTVAHWLKENEPNSWNRTSKYVNISTYLIYKLTGELKDCVSSIIGHYPINFKKRCWYSNKNLKARIFGIPNRMLFPLVQPGDLLGTIKDDVAKECGLPLNIKIYASGSDKANETLGLGALTTDIGAISYGTASTIELSNKKYIEPEPFLPAYPASVKDWYNMEVQIYRGYWMLSWFSREFVKESSDVNHSIEEILNTSLNSVPPGSDGLIVQPYWGPGLSRPLAKGGIIGFSDVHTREHVYRAIIEGIAYSLKEGLDSIQKRGHMRTSSLRISGGGSRSDDICQITADIFGLPVSRVQTFETTTLGSAISTFVSVGRFQSIEEASEAMVRISKTFYPNEVAHKQYDYLYKKVYIKMYPQLKNIYKDINKFNRR